MRATTAEELEAVAGVAAGLGVGPVTPVVVSLAKHTIVRLAPLPLVTRVHSGEGLSEARAGLTFAPFGEALPLFTVGIDACGDLVATRSRTSDLGAEDRQS